MANIDGVIYGNSRCDISGSDINRKWTKNVNPILFPIVAGVCKLANGLLAEGYEIEYFLDLHGHSRKLGSFMYCCKTVDDVESRIFAWLMSKFTNKFVYEECRFGISNFRRETARGYFGMLLANRKSITLETSYFGYKVGGSLKPFGPEELRELGEALALTVHADTFRTNGVVNWGTVRN
jgi:cytosolic carboxypeptidase protein 2/3